MLNFLEQLKTQFKPMSLSRFNFIVAVWLALAFNFMFFARVFEYTTQYTFSRWVDVATVGIILICYFNLYVQLLQWKPTAKWIASLLVIIAAISSYFVTNLGISITAGQIQNVIQTDRAEIFDILSKPFFAWIMFLGVLPIIFLWLVPIREQTFKHHFKLKMINIVASLLIGFTLIFCNHLYLSDLFRNHTELKWLISPANAMMSTYKYYNDMHHQDMPLQHYAVDAVRVTPTTEQAPKLMVLVVGEAARAESFSLNGYMRNTNPQLSKIENLINFSQVSSCGTSTAVSVPCMFSGMPRTDYDEKVAQHREGLLDIAQRAGYKVTWIDNDSGCKGVCDRVHQISIAPDLKKKYCDADGFCLDDVLVESLKRYLNSVPKHDLTPQLIVLHQRGSHGLAYYERTTAEYSPFQPMCKTNDIQNCDRQQLINSYDNTIVYTDHILSQIIDIIKQNEKYQAGFWYLSDHGESTGENGIYLHGTVYSLAPSQQTHIPMMMWFSQNWQRHHPQQLQCLTMQKQNSLSQDNLFPTLLNLLDIHSQVIQSELNMLNQCTNNQNYRV
ncbi:MAG: phosphoethanolamine--lipid A transferase [Acinetobacter sp.]